MRASSFGQIPGQLFGRRLDLWARSWAQPSEPKKGLPEGAAREARAALSGPRWRSVASLCQCLEQAECLSAVSLKSGRKGAAFGGRPSQSSSSGDAEEKQRERERERGKEGKTKSSGGESAG